MASVVDGRSVRWAYDVGSWKPSQEQWLLATSLIQEDELDRIRRFVFARDSKASIVGRLLMRRMAVETLELPPFASRLFGRTDRGKPYLTVDGDRHPSVALASFNVSHQGSYCVLAAETDRPVGVDVTRMVYEGGKPVPQFFELMTRQFSPREWKAIREPSTETDRVRRFYRHWALKESYVKALGVGIGFDLRRLCFGLKSELNLDAIVTDTTLDVDRSPVTNWTFEESLLDDEHCVAVALGMGMCVRRPAQLFDMVNFDDLVHNLMPLRPSQLSHWTEFTAKPESPS